MLASILTHTPPSVTDVNPALPSLLGRIIRRCLAKDSARRFQTATDIRNELEELKQDLVSGAVEASVAPWPTWKHRWRVWAVVGAAVVVLATVWLSWFVGPKSRPSAGRFTNPVQITASAGLEAWPTWSPEGTRLAYQSDRSGNYDIWVTQLGAGSALNRTEDHEGNDQYPAWSPDGRYIAFRSSRDGGGIFITSPLAGRARRVSRRDTAVRGSAQWSADSSEVAYAVNDSGAWFVEFASLEDEQFRRVALPPGTKGCWDLSWSPDGRHFAYLDTGSSGNNYQPLRIFSLDTNRSVLVTDEFRVLRGPSFSGDVRSLYFVANAGGATDLYEQRLTKNGRPEGSPRAITTALQLYGWGAFSPDGSKLAYSLGRRVSNLWRLPVLEDRYATWEDADQLTYDDAYTEFVDVSSDGQRLLFTSDRTGNSEIWLMALGDREVHNLTNNPALDNDGKWSPDGEQIAFYSNRAGDRDIWVIPARGGPARRLTETETEEGGPSWSPDGKEIAFDVSGGGVQAVALADGSRRPLASTGQWPDWSPDGRWIAYVPLPGEFDGIWLVPSSGGTPERLTNEVVAETPTRAGMLRSGNPYFRLRWSRDAKHVYYLDNFRREIRAVSLANGTERTLAKLADKAGRFRGENFATDGTSIYFIWGGYRTDIWVMDVVTDESE